MWRLSVNISFDRGGGPVAVFQPKGGSMPVDDDLKAKLHRYVSDFNAGVKAKRQADEEEEVRRRDHLLAFRAKMKETVEPVLEAVCEEVREAGLEAARFSPLASEDAVSLSIGRAGLGYSPSKNFSDVEIRIWSERRHEEGRLGLDEMTPATVKRHVEALVRVARGEPLGAGWAG